MTKRDYEDVYAEAWKTLWWKEPHVRGLPGEPPATIDARRDWKMQLAEKMQLDKVKPTRYVR